jgi:RHS repeat-associated protein
LGAAQYYLPDVLSYSDYYPFGMQMPGRNASTGDYRYGFNGMELDDEIKGSGNSYDFGARMYDSRIGRWLSLDSKAKESPYDSPYLSFVNNPIYVVDPDGNSGVAYRDEEAKTITVKSTIYYYGSKASPALAKQTATNIEAKWNEGAGKIMLNGVQYDVKFEVNGLYATEGQVKDLAAANTSAENNFVRVTDGSTFNTAAAGIKSSRFSGVNQVGDIVGGNSGYFLDYEMGGGQTTDAHELGHGWGWEEAGECLGGAHDCTILNGIPGIMSARGTAVADAYGYPNQPSGSRTLQTTKRSVLVSDITKLKISHIALSAVGISNVGVVDNKLFNEDGTEMVNNSTINSSLFKSLILTGINTIIEAQNPE